MKSYGNGNGNNKNENQNEIFKSEILGDFENIEKEKEKGIGNFLEFILSIREKIRNRYKFVSTPYLDCDSIPKVQIINKKYLKKTEKDKIDEAWKKLIKQYITLVNSIYAGDNNSKILFWTRIKNEAQEFFNVFGEMKQEEFMKELSNAYKNVKDGQQIGNLVQFIVDCKDMIDQRYVFVEHLVDAPNK